MLQILRCVGRDEYATSASIGEGGDNDMHRPFFFFFDKLLHSHRDPLAVQSTRRSMCTDSNVGITWADKAKGNKRRGGGRMQFTFHSVCIVKVCIVKVCTQLAVENQEFIRLLSLSHLPCKSYV